MYLDAKHGLWEGQIVTGLKLLYVGMMSNRENKMDWQTGKLRNSN